MAHIHLKNISKRYRKNMRSFGALFGYMFSIPHPDDFWALDTISLDLKDGDILGIIGHNGAGKSTLLKIISGITTPTKGARSVEGRIAPLIEVGAGFQPELTGYENIFFYGTILGMSRKEIQEKINTIIEFSGVEDTIHTPVKFYSSGMFARLGFAITVHANPEILIIDEALAVGDPGFQEKCFRKVAELQKSGCITILVSHDLNMIQNHTNTCMWLDRGKIKEYGTTQKILSQYKKAHSHTGSLHYVAQKYDLNIHEFTLTSSPTPQWYESIKFHTTIETGINIPERLRCSLNVFTEQNMHVCTGIYSQPLEKNMRCSFDIEIPEKTLNEINYLISLSFFDEVTKKHIAESDTLRISVQKHILPKMIIPGTTYLDISWLEKK
jgi:lipopolysaccharide transport system ATP-binding protein